MLTATDLNAQKLYGLLFPNESVLLVDKSQSLTDKSALSTD